MLTFLLTFMLAFGSDAQASPDAADSTPAETLPKTVRSVNIQLSDDDEEPPPPEPTSFTARFTAADLTPLLTHHVELLPLPFQFEQQRQACQDALDRVSMEAVVQRLETWLAEQFPDRFDRNRDLIVAPVPDAKQVTLDAPFLDSGVFRGPTEEVIGFLLNEIDERTYINVAIRVMQAARQLLDTGDPAVDRSSNAYYELAASRELAMLIEANQLRQAEFTDKEEIRKRIGESLGVFTETGEIDESKAQWMKESRRFTYVVREGKFIDKLQPLVEKINREIELAGFQPPSLIDQPGIHFDEDLQDVEILLPRPMLESFLEEADALERRMAEDAMITVEVVRLTDRDILSGAVASRLDVLAQGVHDVSRFNPRAVLRQAGINALTAVANRELQIVNLREIEAGTLPEGTPPVTIPAVELPPLDLQRTATTVAGDFSIGADDVFFDGREQTYGFSYIGPDGIQHTLSLSVADSLREFWERIERNLIVHKIRKTPSREMFSVPVGPETKTFEGIAALISQENQELVVATGTGAISELSATAGTWLVIKDFEIKPIPGSSTALRKEEIQEIEDRVLLTMLLRDPLVEVEDKTALVEVDSRAPFDALLERLLAKYRERPLRSGRNVRTFGALYEHRLRETIKAAAIEKKERNSKITLTFYSSQGTIINQPGVTALGDANDLTSFTTELSPNTVTPISSFFTKSASGTQDESSLTGFAKGERSDKEKTMTHLVVRARFPTEERELKDREEGRYIGYFELPMKRESLSTVNLPFLSSSDHPLERLSQIRVGMMFPSLDRSKIRKPWQLLNPNRLIGNVPLEVWKACMTRMLMNRRMVTMSPDSNQALAASYRQRFIIEVRSLLEYDEDLFDAPNIALRNMAHWNDPHRVVLALNNSSDRFARHRLILMLDELGRTLVSDAFIQQWVAVVERDFWGHERIRGLTEDEARSLRRDVAAHFLRIEEVFGDAVLEAISLLLGLSRYMTLDYDAATCGPFHGYEQLALFDKTAEAYTESEVVEIAHADFLLLRSGGYKGKFFEPSLEFLEHLPKEHRQLVIVGREILDHPLMETSADVP